jgi:hypothetical protein
LKGCTFNFKINIRVRIACTLHLHLRMVMIYGQEITGAVAEVTPHKLSRTLEEIIYRWDICRAATGSHIAHVRKNLTCLATVLCI